MNRPQHVHESQLFYIRWQSVYTFESNKITNDKCLMLWSRTYERTAECDASSMLCDVDTHVHKLLRSARKLQAPLTIIKVIDLELEPGFEDNTTSKRNTCLHVVIN